MGCAFISSCSVFKEFGWTLFLIVTRVLYTAIYQIQSKYTPTTVHKHVRCDQLRGKAEAEKGGGWGRLRLCEESLFHFLHIST